MKHIFIVNPTSGKGDGKRAAAAIQKEIEQNHLDGEIRLTEYAGQAQKLAAEIKPDPETIVYAVGGDGTIWEVLNGLPPGLRMGILPCGTGNDYYRMIDQRKLPFAQMLHETIQGKPVEVDFGQCHHWRFHNCTTLGLDARVNDLAIKLYQNYPLPRFSVYGLAAVLCALKPAPFELVLKTETEMIRQKAIIAAVMNGSCYGNGFIAAPQADLQDGLFDICVIEPLTLWETLWLMPKYKQGKHTHLKQCKMLRASEIEIHVDKPILMQSDGEGFTSNHVRISTGPYKLPLIVPQASPLKAGTKE